MTPEEHKKNVIDYQAKEFRNTIYGLCETFDWDKKEVIKYVIKMLKEEK